MPTTRPAITAEQARKKCLACGFDGRALQGERGRLTFECPSCGADLYARPPRSYAELEGLIEPSTIDRPAGRTSRSSIRPMLRPHRQRASREPADGRRRAGAALERALIVSIGAVFVVASIAGAVAVAV